MGKGRGIILCCCVLLFIMSLNLGCSRKEGLEQAEVELIEDHLVLQVLNTAVP